MQVVVLCVGKLKEKYWKAAVEEYGKRLGPYVNLSIVEVPDEAVPETLSQAQQLALVETEGQRIIKHLRQRDGVVAMDMHGTQLTSEDWSDKFVALQGQGFGRLVFIVGGSCGLSPEVLHRADFRWSLSPMTLPHQLARVVLLEQIYRGIRIARNEPYHK